MWTSLGQNFFLFVSNKQRCGVVCGEQRYEKKKRMARSHRLVSEYHAACRIQARYRGNAARKQYQAMLELREKSALEIQVSSAPRGGTSDAVVNDTDVTDALSKFA